MHGNDVEKVQMLLEESSDDLLADIGKQQAGKLMVDLSFQAALKLGQRWYQANKETLLNHVCGSDKVREFSVESRIGGYSVELITAILDLIAGLCGKVSPATVCALLLKEGLNVVCATRWSESNT